MSKAILILGMHRSGTSALAGCLARLGVALGDRLVEGTPADNPDGFYEHRDIVEIHDSVLLRHGRTWDDPRPASATLTDAGIRTELAIALDAVVTRDFAAAPLWAVKDPRLCRVLPVWLELLTRRGVDVACCVSLRDPAEVVASLQARNGFSREKASALWLDHVLAPLATSGYRSTSVRFDDLLDDPASAVQRCGQDLKLEWPTSPVAVAQDLRQFVRPRLRHHRGSGQKPAGPIEELACRLWERLERAPLGSDECDAFANELFVHLNGVPTLAFEHLTHIAVRLSKECSWRAETTLRDHVSDTRDRLESLITSLEGRISQTLHKVATEVVAHAGELVTLGREVTKVRELAQRLEGQVDASDKRSNE